MNSIQNRLQYDTVLKNFPVKVCLSNEDQTKLKQKPSFHHSHDTYLRRFFVSFNLMPSI